MRMLLMAVRLMAVIPPDGVKAAKSAMAAWTPVFEPPAGYASAEAAK